MFVAQFPAAEVLERAGRGRDARDGASPVAVQSLTDHALSRDGPTVCFFCGQRVRVRPLPVGTAMYLAGPPGAGTEEPDNAHSQWRPRAGASQQAAYLSPSWWRMDASPSARRFSLARRCKASRRLRSAAVTPSGRSIRTRRFDLSPRQARSSASIRVSSGTMTEMAVGSSLPAEFGGASGQPTRRPGRLPTPRLRNLPGLCKVIGCQPELTSIRLAQPALPPTASTPPLLSAPFRRGAGCAQAAIRSRRLRESHPK